MTRLEKFAGALDRFIDVLGRITAWSALALVLVMAYNVLLRYFFRTGSVALQEMEWHLMAVLALLCISYSTLKDGHVQVDVLYRTFPPVMQRIIHFISCLLIVIVAAIIFRLSIPYVLQSYNIGERSPDPGGLGQRWIVKSMIPLGFALLFIQSFAALLRASIAIVTGRSAQPAGDRGAERAG